MFINNSLVVGLTGGISSGKSKVAEILEHNNIPQIDADLIARKVVEPNTPALSKIINKFGIHLLNSDGSLKRNELGKLVFNNIYRLNQLNEIMVPFLREEIDKNIFSLSQQNYPIIIYNAALIVEMDEVERFRPLVVVTCDKETQIVRLMSRNGLTRDEALLRINAQFPVDKKIQAADFIIENNGSLEDLTNKTINILNKIKESHGIQ